MLKLGGRLLIVLALIVMAGVFAEIYALKKTELDIDNIEIEKLSLSQLELNLRIKATNPTPFDTYIVNQHIEIYGDGKLFGVVNKEQPVALAKKSSAYFDYPLLVTSLSALELLFKNKVAKQPIAIKMTGKLLIKAPWIGYSVQIPIEEEQSLAP